MRGAAVALVLAGACGEPADPDCDGVDYQTTAQPFLRTWCTSCHSAAVPAGARQEAPLGVDFDTYAGAVRWAPAIRPQIAGDDPAMPPSGGLPRDDRDAFVAWLDCEVPGATPTPPDPCAEPRRLQGDVVGGPATCTSPEAGVHVAGSLTVADNADLRCVCAVDGDARLDAPQVALPRLQEVGGSVQIGGAAASVRLVGLRAAAALTVASSALTDLAVPRLATVEGDLDVHEAALTTLDLGGVVTVGGDLLVERLPALEVLSLDRLEVVGGSLTVQDLPALRLVLDTHGLARVGGHVIYQGLPSLARLDGHSVLTEVGGDVVIRATGITHLRGFDRLVDLPGGVTLAEHPQLEVVTGLPDLRAVGGSLVVHDNDALEQIESLVFLETVGGDVSFEDHARLEALPGLTELRRVDGGVRVIDNPALPQADAEAAFAGVAVGGAVDIRNNRD